MGQMEHFGEINYSSVLENEQLQFLGIEFLEVSVSWFLKKSLLVRHSHNRFLSEITMMITLENMELEIISPQIQDLKIEPLTFSMRNLILKKGLKELSVTLLWKGKVDGDLYIGCELV